MKNGTVKWFNAKKGFGFLVGDDGKDYFVHYTSIVKEGFKSLDEGQSVTFDLATNEKGEVADNVQLV